MIRAFCLKKRPNCCVTFFKLNGKKQKRVIYYNSKKFYELFQILKVRVSVDSLEGGLALLDRSIPFYNTILRCDDYQHRDVVLPDGFCIVPYKEGYEKAWAELEFSVGDFDSLEEAEHYFVSSYMQDRELLDKNVRFLLNGEQVVIGSCIAWQDKRQDSVVPSLHWLIVDDKYQGRGLGRALCCEIMNIFEEQGRFPVYIHTQPWSWKAIFLYLSVGFKLQMTDTFSHYTNEYPQAMDILKGIVDEKQFRLLTERSEK